MSPRFSLTLIGAGLGLAISAAAFTTATFTQRLIPIEWAALLLAGTTGTGAVVGRVSDRQRAVFSGSGLPQRATGLQRPHPEDPGAGGLYQETCTTVATHLCQVPPGSEEYQEALVAGSVVTTHLRFALVGDAPRRHWQAMIDRWNTAPIESANHGVDAISGAPISFSSVQPKEEQTYEPDPTPIASDSGGSALPEAPAFLSTFLASGHAPAAPVEESIPAGLGASHRSSDYADGSFSLDDEWDQPASAV